MGQDKQNKFNSYSFYQMVKEYIIRIPMLQRDYAYGRPHEVQRRSAFLEKLKEYLDDDKQHKLDFIYGSTKENAEHKKELVVLDGQQRVTTLFLLHWYLSLINGTDGKNQYATFKELLYTDNHCRFVYATRDSSAAFCEFMVSFEEADQRKYAELINNPDHVHPISEMLRKDKQFLYNWNYDPSITGMLNMLDAIQTFFPVQDCQDKNYYGRLHPDNNGESCIIFNFLPLDKYGLTDELYVKMNGRGKPLTRYENLKSILLSLYDKLDTTEQVYKDYLKLLKKIITDLPGNQTKEAPKTLRECVAYMLDVVWVGMFWELFKQKYQDWEKKYKAGKKKLKEKPKPDIDNMMLSFITVMAINDYIVNVEKIENKDEKETIDADKKYVTETYKKYTDPDYIDKLLKEKDKNGITISYADYERLFKVNNYCFLYHIIDYFNIYKRYSDKGAYLDGFAYNNIQNSKKGLDEEKLFTFLTHSYALDLEKRFMLFAFVSCFPPHSSYDSNDPDNDSYDPDKLKKWMRFVCNVQENSNVNNSVKDFCNAIKSISYLYDNFDRIEKLKDNEYEKIVGLDQWQIREEQLKRKLVLADEDKWKAPIQEAEEKLWPYFGGRLNFPLIYCLGVKEEDLEDYLYGKVDYKQTVYYAEDSAAAFNDYVAKLSKIFQDKDTLEPLLNVLSRAVLSKGNYLLKFKTNYSLLVVSDRDISWKRYLKEKPDALDSVIFKSSTDDDSTSSTDDASTSSTDDASTSSTVDDRREYFKMVLDDDKFDLNKDIDDILKDIIGKQQQQKDAPAWRRRLVGCENVFDNDVITLGASRSLRWNTASKNLKPDKPDKAQTEDDYEIDLLSGERLNGAHAELFSLCKYLELKMPKNKNDSLPSDVILAYQTTHSESEQPYFTAERNGKTLKFFYCGGDQFTVEGAADNSPIKYDKITADYVDKELK